MQLFSSSSSSSTSSHFTLLPAAQSPHPSTSKSIFKIPTTKFLNSNPTLISIIASCSSKESPAPLSDTQQKELINRRNQVSDPEIGNHDDPDAFLTVRRPVMENYDDDADDGTSRSSPIDKSLYDFAKKVAIFEPESTEMNSREKKPPLTVNLDLALYKAKVLARNYQFQEAEKVLERCVYLWPEDGRPYVALGKVLSKQNKTDDARAVYEKGCQATQGENPYIWQCWAVLENKVGNIRKARELFDASTVADKKHVAAWHGWANLEIKQGNIKKARNLLAKALKFCGGNEYVYQTLALLEAKANRYEQARYLFNQATKCNPKSCASWLSWAQLEVQQRNHRAARQLFEKAVQASPKNRFAWHVWGVFEANSGNIETARKLLKIGHALNPRDPVLLQSLALIEYSNSTANLARVLFKRASELDPKHQPVWVAWGWMEWKEGNIATARELYQRALSINSTSESAARCLQAWGVLEQRVGNLSAARRLFRSSLNINSQSYVTWMTWASLEEAQGNSGRAEEVRDFYFQQRTEVVDDASWVMGFLDVIDPAIDSVKRLLKLDQNPNSYKELLLRYNLGDKEDFVYNENASSAFDLDTFIREKLFLDPSKLDTQLDSSQKFIPRKPGPSRRVWRSENQSSTSKYQLQTGQPVNDILEL